MSQGIRQSLSGLHTWVGLVFGWVLMAVFVGGTLSVFAAPISLWMIGVPRPPEREPTIASSLRAVDSRQYLVTSITAAGSRARRYLVRFCQLSGSEPRMKR